MVRVACCLLHAVCCLILVVCGMLLVVRCVLVAVRSFLFVVCGVLGVCVLRVASSVPLAAPSLLYAVVVGSSLLVVLFWLSFAVRC